MRSSLPETYETSTLGWRARILTSSSPVYPVAPTTPTLNFFAIFIALLLDFFIYLASHYYRQIYAICQKSCPPTRDRVAPCSTLLFVTNRYALGQTGSL